MNVILQFTLENSLGFNHNYIQNKLDNIPKLERIKTNYLTPHIINLKINNEMNTRQQGDKKEKQIN